MGGGKHVESKREGYNDSIQLVAAPGVDGGCANGDGDDHGDGDGEWRFAPRSMKLTPESASIFSFI